MNARDDPCGDEQRHRVDDQTQQEEHNPTAPTIRPTLPSPPPPAPANTTSPCERSGGASTVDVAASRAQTRQRALLTERPFSAIRPPAPPGPLYHRTRDCAAFLAIAQSTLHPRPSSSL